MRVMLIDGTNLLVRAVKATERLPLSSDDGVPTAALMVFINMLSRHIREESPTHVVVAWDGGKSQYRREIWEGYKAARGPAVEDEPERPVHQAREFCTLAGLYHIEREGFEADDIIANYWARSTMWDATVVILSADRDFQQLVDHDVTLVRPMGAGAPSDRWDYERVVAECGVTPGQLPLVKALMGDVSDGVPGLTGVGPKKAAKRVRVYGGNVMGLVHDLDSEDQRIVLRNLALMDLRNSAPQTPVSNPPEFRPTRPGDLAWEGFSGYLDRYSLSSVKTRLMRGTLWGADDGADLSIQV